MDIPALIAGRESWGTLMVLALSGLMIMVGLAFKLSAVPFHFWCPDVFEGASAEVDAFLSVASKAAAMALLIRVALGVSAVETPATTAARNPAPLPSPVLAGQFDPPATVAAPNDQPATRTQARFVAQTAPAQPVAPAAPATPAAGTASLAPIRTFVVRLLAIVAAVTCTFGNLAAYGQTNMKRLLAYSTIAHAGYMIMAVAAAVHLAGTDPGGAQKAVAALLVYLLLYVFMNLGAFAIVAFLRSAIRSEEIADYAGLIRSAPLTAVALTVILVSLIGLPPMAGFVAKLVVFLSLVTAGGPWMIALLVIAGINTVISLIYYLRVAKTVCIDPEPESRGPVAIGLLPAAFVLVVALPVLYYGILPGRVMEVAEQAARQLLM
jgi:NADH-quinone oxidoreductase subunit N